MNEDYLQFIWRYGLLKDYSTLKTTDGSSLEIVSPGLLNTYSGPDFSNAKIKIGDTLWVGNVEIHIKSSFWNQHGHQHDSAYNNVILHVVLENDVDIVVNNRVLKVFQLDHQYFPLSYENYINLQDSKTFISCENITPIINKQEIAIWYQKLLFQRFQTKISSIQEIFHHQKGDHEKTLFLINAKALGQKANVEPFLILAQQISLTILSKIRYNTLSVYAYFLGIANLLPAIPTSLWEKNLILEFQYLSKKYQLEIINLDWKKGGVRHFSMPAYKVSVLAAMYLRSEHFLSLLKDIYHCDDLETWWKEIKIPDYFQENYDWGKKRKKEQMTLPKTLFEHLVVNAWVPYLFFYYHNKGSFTKQDNILSWLEFIGSENNSIVKKMSKIFYSENSSHSQALLELYKVYCKPKKCLNCVIGWKILKN